jgi:hypothetical protein
MGKGEAWPKLQTSTSKQNLRYYSESKQMNRLRRGSALALVLILAFAKSKRSHARCHPLDQSALDATVTAIATST